MVRVWLPPHQPGSRPMAPYQLPEPRLPDMLQAEKQGQSQGGDQCHIHKNWGRERLTTDPMPQTSRPKGLRPSDCGKLHLVVTDRKERGPHLV